MGDKKEAVVTTPFPKKKSCTKDIDKGIDELEYMKEAVVIIRRNDSDKFERQSKGYTGWFNLDSDFLIIFLQSNQTSIKIYVKRILKVKKWNRINVFRTIWYIIYHDKIFNHFNKLDYYIRSNSTRGNSGEQT